MSVEALAKTEDFGQCSVCTPGSLTRAQPSPNCSQFGYLRDLRSHLPRHIPPRYRTQHSQFLRQHLRRRLPLHFLTPAMRAGNKPILRTRQRQHRPLPRSQHQRVHPTGKRFPKPRLPPLVQGQPLQHTAVLGIEKHAPCPRKMRGEIIRQLTGFRRPGHRPPLSRITPNKSTLLRLAPSIVRQLPPPFLHHSPDHRHLLLPDDRPVVATRRPATRQLTPHQSPLERPMIDRRLAHLLRKIGGRLFKGRIVLRLRHQGFVVPPSLARNSPEGDGGRRKRGNLPRFPPHRSPGATNSGSPWPGIPPPTVHIHDILGPP